ncbi:MAG: hypothetical protein FJ395_01975 [Verrucomicrobia bacterium]|nr:hypothetical protein [Verrucomicrobiota bacterium]
MQNNINRRVFLKTMATVGAGAVSLTSCVTSSRTSTRLRANPWRKRGVVLASDESGRVQNFTSVVEPLDSGAWRLWFSVSGKNVPFNVGIAEGRPGQPMKRCPAVLSEGEPADAPLAIGNLPRDWRPVQAVHVPLPGNRHRLYFWAHGPKVVRYLAAESDDGRRFRVLDPHRPCLYHPSDRAVDGRTAAEAGLSRLAKKVATRPDNEPPAPVRLVSNDATNVYRLPDGTFEMYSVALIEVPKDDPRYIAHDNAAGWIRVIDRYASTDGLDWTNRRRILVADANDPVDQQFYYLSVTHTPRGRIGMLGHYRVQAQTMDLEVCFSADGITWQRDQRRAWIPRGEPGEPDSYGIYAPHALVQRAGLWHLFYTGVNDAHNHKHSHGPPTRVVMHATCENLWA